jgi:hypothetical protein
VYQQVLLPVIEDLAPTEPDPVNHYWLLVMNIRDRRFEVLDSLRSLKDKNLSASVDKILAAINVLWDMYYANSKVKLEKFKLQDFRPPKQLTK